MPRWTTESRAKQSDLIRNWAPWKESTGPRTDAGKAVVGQNARRVTIRKLLLMACYIGKQQDAMMAGKPWDGREEVNRRLERCICEKSGLAVD